MATSGESAWEAGSANPAIPSASGRWISLGSSAESAQEVSARSDRRQASAERRHREDGARYLNRKQLWFMQPLQ
jgi:hypothetical protein